MEDPILKVQAKCHQPTTQHQAICIVRNLRQELRQHVANNEEGCFCNMHQYLIRKYIRIT